MTTPVAVDRGFLRLTEGLVHYRHAQPVTPSDRAPLYLAHASPNSSRSLEPLVALLGASRQVIAPDTLGNGDSPPPAPATPDLGYYADSMVRVMDALGLEQVDFFGTHTGAYIGIELLLRHPDRVRRAVFEGVKVYEDDLRAEVIARYAPPMKPDDHGGHMIWAWNWYRDTALHYPYYRRDPEHRLPFTTVGSADELLPKAIELLKALGTYHQAYQAVFHHDTATRLLMITKTPLRMVMPAADPTAAFATQWENLPANISEGSLGPKAGVAEQAAFIAEFLDG